VKREPKPHGAVPRVTPPDCDVCPNYWLCHSDFYNPMFLFKSGFSFLLLGGAAAPDSRVKDIAGVPAALNKAIKNLGAHCKNVLPTQQTLLEDAKDLKFFDARAGVSGSETVAQIAPALDGSPVHVLPTTTWVDPHSTGDLRRWGALLTGGWAEFSGSPNDLEKIPPG